MTEECREPWNPTRGSDCGLTCQACRLAFLMYRLDRLGRDIERFDRRYILGRNSFPDDRYYPTWKDIRSEFDHIRLAVMSWTPVRMS